MLEVLKELNRTPGVRGSAVLMGDGVVMASLLAPGSDADSVAALVSSLASSIVKNVSRLDMGKLRRILVTSNRGCFSANYLGNAWLVADLELEIDPGSLELEVESAAMRIRRLLRRRGAEVPAVLPSDEDATTEPSLDFSAEAPNAHEGERP